MARASGERSDDFSRERVLLPTASAEEAAPVSTHGALRGRVVDTSGTGVPAVAITIHAEARTTTRKGRWHEVARATSDEDGTFRIDALLPGRHRVDGAAPPGFLPTPEGAVVVDERARPPGFFATLATIPPEGGEVDVTLVLLRPGVVRGVVLDPEGRGVAGMQVRAQCSAAGMQSIACDAITAADGRFELAAPPARYRVRCCVAPESRLAVVCRPAPFDFTLFEGDSRELPPLRFGGDGGAVAGRVVDEQGAPFAGLEVLCWFAEEMPLPHDWSSALLRTTTAATGEFRLEGLPACRVAVQIAPEGFLPGREATNLLAWWLPPVECDLRRERAVTLPETRAIRSHRYELELALTGAIERVKLVRAELREPREPTAALWVLAQPRILQRAGAGAYRFACATPHPALELRVLGDERGREIVLASTALAPAEGRARVELTVPEQHDR